MTVIDWSYAFTLPGTTPGAKLQSRNFYWGEGDGTKATPGDAGLPGSGLYPYRWRIALEQASPNPDVMCVSSFTIPFGPHVQLDFDGDGTDDDVYWFTDGLGSSPPTSAIKCGDFITFHFVDPVCVGATSHFFGLVSGADPRLDVMANLTLANDGSQFPVEVTVPKICNNGKQTLLPTSSPTASPFKDSLNVSVLL